MSEKKSREIRDQRITGFAERLRQAIGPRSQSLFAQQCGLSEGVIRSYLRGDTYPTLDRLTVLAEAGGARLEWLATGAVTDEDGVLAYAARFKDFVLVPGIAPIASIAPSAPPGRGPAPAAPLDPGLAAPAPPAPPHLAFRRAWLRAEIAADPATLAFFHNEGDLMAPTIVDGDLLLLDASDGLARRPGVYAIEYEGVRIAKRLERHPGGRLMLRGDNPAYPAAWVDAADQSPLRILGRVVWIGRIC
jgi:transcriptional regulator with XRE-family HTH domain